MRKFLIRFIGAFFDGLKITEVFVAFLMFAIAFLLVPINNEVEDFWSQVPYWFLMALFFFVVGFIAKRYSSRSPSLFEYDSVFRYALVGAVSLFLFLPVCYFARPEAFGLVMLLFSVEVGLAVGKTACVLCQRGSGK